MTISIRLRELRSQYSYSLSEVAKYLGVTTSTISRFELGEREPNIEKLLKLADFYKVSIDFLLGRVTVDNSGEKLHVESISNKIDLIQKQLDEIKELLK